MTSRKLSLFAVALLATSCIHAQPVVEKTAVPQAGSAYVAAAFSITERSQFFLFGLVDAQGNEYVMPFSSTSRKGFLDEDRLEMIALKPGDYRLAFWSRSNDRGHAQEVPPTRALGRPFHVEAGHVLLLGRFDARVKVDVVFQVTTQQVIETFSVSPRALRADEASRLFAEAYPGFADAPLECMACQAPAPGAASSASPVMPETGDFSSAHDVVIHSHRLDGKKKDAQEIKAWETFDGSSDRRELRSPTEGSRLRPTGHDDFGEFWVLNELAFRNGRVTLAVWDLDRKYSRNPPEHGFMISQGRAVWINEGDPKVYFSREEAEAAQAK